MPEAAPPSALLLLTRNCPHCPALLTGLAELLKRGIIGRLEAVNIEAAPELARQWQVRSVPWLRLGPFQLTGALTLGELETWAARAGDLDRGLADALHDLLKTGGARQVLDLVREVPSRLAALLPIVANPEASLNVRLGAGMVFEELAGPDGHDALVALVPRLAELARHSDPRVRADAAHLLGLSRAIGARAFLTPMLDDPDADVREIAQESLAALGPSAVSAAGGLKS